MKLASIVLFALATLIALPAAAQTASDMQILAQKVKADKKLVVAANMQLTKEEAKGFWPVYSDGAAKKLINEAIAIEEAEVRLKRSYLPKLEKVIPGMKVARYLQIENKIRAIGKYELGAQIPLVQ